MLLYLVGSSSSCSLFGCSSCCCCSCWYALVEFVQNETRQLHETDLPSHWHNSHGIRTFTYIPDLLDTMATPTYYYCFNDAMDTKLDQQWIWAKSKQRADGKWTNKYICATPQTLLSHIQATDQEHWWYEVISLKSHCLFHLDIMTEF